MRYLYVEKLYFCRIKNENFGKTKPIFGSIGKNQINKTLNCVFIKYEIKNLMFSLFKAYRL